MTLGKAVNNGHWNIFSGLERGKEPGLLSSHALAEGTWSPIRDCRVAKERGLLPHRRNQKLRAEKINSAVALSSGYEHDRIIFGTHD